MNGSCGLGGWAHAPPPSPLLRGMWAGDGSTLGCIFDQIAAAFASACAQAARDDDLAFSARASPIASRLSFTASSMNPQVLTMTSRRPRRSWGFVALGAGVRMSSESVSALGQPRLTNPTLVFLWGECFAHPLLSQFRGRRLLAPQYRARKHWMQVQKSCDQRPSPNAPSICSVCFLHLLLHLREHGLGLLRLVAHHAPGAWATAGS